MQNFEYEGRLLNRNSGLHFFSPLPMLPYLNGQSGCMEILLNADSNGVGLGWDPR